jgi:hypothetical protein
MRIKALFVHGSQVVLEAALIASLVAMLAVGTTFAAKGGGGGGSKPHHGSSSSSLALVMVTDNNGNGLPNWADTVTFNISTTATTNPYVALKCYQGGVVVYSASAGFYPDYPWPWTQDMTLSSSMWTGGSASCTAVLNDGLATLNFTAGA